MLPHVAHWQGYKHGYTELEGHTDKGSGHVTRTWHVMIGNGEQF